MAGARGDPATFIVGVGTDKSAENRDARGGQKRERRLQADHQAASAAEQRGRRRAGHSVHRARANESPAELDFVLIFDLI